MTCDSNGYGRDRLPYPYSYETCIEQPSQYDFVENNDPNPLVGADWYVVSATPQQMFKMMSALQAGADLIYPDEWHEIIMPFLQAKDYPNEIPDNSYMKFCKLMADCIRAITENESLTEGQIELLDAMNDYSQKNGAASSGNKNNPDTYNSNPLLLDGGQGCNNDNLFGAATGLVDLFDGVVTDAFELIESKTNFVEVIGLVLSVFPLTNVLGGDEIADFVNTIQESLAENYAAQYTLQIRDEMRCDLFCAARDNDCQLTLDMVADYFVSKAQQSIKNEPFEQAVGFLIGTSITGALVVYSSFALVSIALAYGSRFFGALGIDWLSRAVQASFNDPDSDWSILCDDCVVCNYDDLQLSPYNWLPMVNNQGDNVAVYVDGNGYGATSPRNGEVWISNNIVQSEIKSVSFKLSSLLVGPNPVKAIELLLNGTSVYLDVVNGTGKSMGITLANSIVANEIRLYADTDGGSSIQTPYDGYIEYVDYCYG